MVFLSLVLFASSAIAQVHIYNGVTPSPTQPPPAGWVTSAPMPSFPPGPYVLDGPPDKPPLGAWWDYPRAPIPDTKMKPAQDLMPKLGAHVEDGPQTREYTFNVGYAAGYPDGFIRRMTLINEQFPGPMIEAVQGDTIVVHVHNNIDTPTTVHWHGIQQNGTVHMDGVPGFTQCPIPPGGSFTYKFTLTKEFGTYWYHAHFGNMAADGMFGALVVHSKDDPLRDKFDKDHLLFVGDYWHDQSETIVDAAKNPDVLFRGVPIVDLPDSVLLNGIGQTDCGCAARDVPCYNGVPPAEVHAAAGTRLRLRLFQVGSHSMQYFSIDGHRLEVVEADDTPIESVWTRELAFGPGQRYSVIVHLDQGANGDSFWIRAHAAIGCYNDQWRFDGKAVLRYTDGSDGDATEPSMPTSEQWPDLIDTTHPPCRDMDDVGFAMKPLIPEDPPAVAEEQHLFMSSLGKFKNPRDGSDYIGWGFNKVSWVNHPNSPFLSVLQDGGRLDENRIAYADFTGTGAADIIINNLDGAPHPFHLHGRPFYLVGRGSGILNTTEGVELNLHNPLRRDTLMMGPKSWVVMRLVLDNPGVWGLHCHIGWHLSVGKMAAVVVRPDAIRGMDRPDDWLALCDGTDPIAIGPDRRRRLPPQARAATNDDSSAAR